MPKKIDFLDASIIPQMGAVSTIFTNLYKLSELAQGALVLIGRPGFRRVTGVYGRLPDFRSAARLHSSQDMLQAGGNK